MTHTLKRLLDLDAVSGDDRFAVRALFHDPTDMALTHVALDIGGWLDRREVLIAIERFGPPTDDGWPLDMSREALDEAPQIEGDSSMLSSLPPLIVGPFGYTFSPMLMAAGLDGQATSPPDGDIVAEAGGRLGGIERSTDWLGREAFGPDGALGKIHDMQLDGLRLVAVLLDDGTERPLSAIRSQPGDGHIVFE